MTRRSDLRGKRAAPVELERAQNKKGEKTNPDSPRQLTLGGAQRYKTGQITAQR